MRNLTKQEVSNVAGAMAMSCFIEEGFAWSVTNQSSFVFDLYEYTASSVKDEYGRVVFSGHSGEFKNSAGKTCYVHPFETGNLYLYLYDM